jgi:hypothetical protein
LLDKSLLIGCEFHFHGFSVWPSGYGVKAYPASVLPVSLISEYQ